MNFIRLVVAGNDMFFKNINDASTWCRKAYKHAYCVEVTTDRIIVKTKTGSNDDKLYFLRYYTESFVNVA